MSIFEIVDIAGVIFSYLPTRDFLNMRLNMWLNDLICNRALNTMHIISVYANDDPNYITHIRNLWFRINNCRYTLHDSCNCTIPDVPKDRVITYAITCRGKDSDISEYSHLENLRVSSYGSTYDNIVLFSRDKQLNMPYMHVLDLFKSAIGDQMLQFTSITSLRINEKCGDIDHISVLTNLTSLEIDFYNRVKDESLYSLTNLHKLRISGNKHITNDGIIRLTNLVYLDLMSNNIVTNQGIQYMTNLTDISLNFNKSITDEGISHLTNITCLRLVENLVISSKVFHSLTNISAVDIRGRNLITMDSLLCLPGLKIISDNATSQKYYSQLKGCEIVTRLDDIM